MPCCGVRKMSPHHGLRTEPHGPVLGRVDRCKRGALGAPSEGGPEVPSLKGWPGWALCCLCGGHFVIYLRPFPKQALTSPASRQCGLALCCHQKGTPSVWSAVLPCVFLRPAPCAPRRAHRVECALSGRPSGPLGGAGPALLGREVVQARALWLVSWQALACADSF